MMMNKRHLLAALPVLALSTVLILDGVMDEVYAKKEKGNNKDKNGNGNNGNGSKPNANVRAIQDGRSLGTNPGEEGVLGEDIWCVGGIDAESEANDIHCYLLPDGVPTSEYNNPAYADVVIKIDGDSNNIDDCPDDAGFQPTDICFWILFPADNFPTPGHYQFVAEFTKDGSIIDLAGTDWRNNSFMVVPELIIGSIGLVGSTLGTLYLYKSRSKKAKEEISNPL